MKLKRGIVLCHYNRQKYLEKIIAAIKLTAPADAKIIVADDGSDVIEDLPSVEKITKRQEVILIKGPNKGIAANKNRGLWALSNCNFICLLEDDLLPKEPGWFELYEQAAILSGIHHFCRVQENELEETVPAFLAFMQKNGLTPIYGLKPRGDLTFLTSTVVNTIGAFNPRFKGAGYAHGEWSSRVARAGLINHPLKWVDIQEARNKFEQIGDREGGRWNIDVSDQLRKNRKILKELQRKEYKYHELVLE